MQVKDKRRFNQDGSSKSGSESLQKESQQHRSKIERQLAQVTRILPNRKRSRKQRFNADVYRAVPLFNEETRAEWPASLYVPHLNRRSHG